MKSFHTPRRTKGRDEVLNSIVAELDRLGETDEFLAWSWLILGGKEGNCPHKYSTKQWNELYEKHPELHPADQYHGTF